MLTTNLASLPPRQKAAAAVAKMNSGKAVPILDAILYPDGRDGD